MKTKYLVLLSVFWMIVWAQTQITTRGTLLFFEYSICMDNCGYLYLDPDPGYEGYGITSTQDGWTSLMPYVGEHVEVTGEFTWCVECGAIDVESIEIIPETPDYSVTRGILVEMQAGDCMDGCDEFYVDGDPGWETVNVTTLGSPELLQSFVEEHVEVIGEEVWCVECGAILPAGINRLYDGNLIENGSFEYGGAPDESSWEVTCFAESDDSTPFGTGIWSLKLESGNTQGCFPGTATQTVQQVGTGDILNVSGWVRMENDITGGSIRLKDDEGNILSHGSTQSTVWTFLSFTDTLLTSPGSPVLLELDAGLTGGPVYNSAFFDQIVVLKTGQLEPGDVNADGEQDVLDIVRMVNIIIGTAEDVTGYEQWASDLNEDGEINILDVVSLVNLIIG